MKTSSQQLAKAIKAAKKVRKPVRVAFSVKSGRKSDWAHNDQRRSGRFTFIQMSA